MNKMDKLKSIYQSTEIPAELSETVAKALSEPQPEMQIITGEKQGETKMNTKKRVYRRAIAAVAALAIMVGGFGITVSSNEAFAASVADIPVLGALARVFTGEQVHENNGIVNVEMKLPKVEGLTDKSVEDRINNEIHDKMTALVEESKQRAAEDLDAWVKTGGNPDEYMVRDIYVDYEVKSVTDDVLSFVVSKMETGASSYYELYYYNIDLNTNKDLTLEGLLGKDYISIANKQIEAQIEEMSKIEGNMFFDGSEGLEGFKTITADQNFFVNEQGNVVIVFNKYEIAPGYMGILEFEIK